MPGPSSMTSMVTPASLRRARTCDRRAGGRVADRVLEQVRHDLVDALGVAVGGEAGVLDLHVDGDAGHVQLLLADRVGEHRLDREGLPVEGDGAGLEPGEVEELGDEAAEPLDLGQHRVERAGIGGGDAVDEVLEGRLQRGERGAQLVAHVGDEVAAHAVGLGELGGHLVERHARAGRPRRCEVAVTRWS